MNCRMSHMGKVATNLMLATSHYPEQKKSKKNPSVATISSQVWVQRIACSSFVGLIYTFGKHKSQRQGDRNRFVQTWHPSHKRSDPNTDCLQDSWPHTKCSCGRIACFHWEMQWKAPWYRNSLLWFYMAKFSAWIMNHESKYIKKIKSFRIYPHT